MEPTRYVTDASLDLVARRLRLLGFDVVTHRGARLEELFDAAAREGRTVLTTSGRHPKRWAAVPGLRLPRDARDGVRIVADQGVPAGAPFSRCTECNVGLRTRSRFEAMGEVPGRVARGGSPLTWCPACGRWYWVGSHVARLAAWLSEVTGKPVAPPGASGPVPGNT